MHSSDAESNLRQRPVTWLKFILPSIPGALVFLMPVSNGETALQAGTRLGPARAGQSPGFLGFLANGCRNLVNIWLGLVPATLAIAMLALIVVEYTPVFHWLSMPLIPVLNRAGVADAAAAAPSLVVGFADMYLPALHIMNVHGSIST